MQSLADFGTILMLLLVLLSFYTYFCLFPYQHHKRRIARYRLFNLRDRLIQLVAEDKVREEDEVFQFLYQTLTSAISVAKPLRLRDIVHVLKQSPLFDKRRTELIRETIHHKDVKIREIAIAIALEIACILFEKSFSVKFAVKHTRLALWLCGLLPRVPESQAEAYKMYNIAKEEEEQLLHA